MNDLEQDQLDAIAEMEDGAVSFDIQSQTVNS